MIYRSRGEPKLLRDRRRKRPVDANDRLFVRHGFETRLGGKERNVTAATDLDRARHQVENAAWLNALARVGLVAKGASFALVGILASKLAVESGGKATSRQGALQSLAQHSFGKFLLILLAVGFAAYALWRFAQTFFDKNDVGDGAKGLAKRAGYFGSGTIYAFLTYSTVKIISGAGPAVADPKAHKTTATVLSWQNAGASYSLLRTACGTE